MFVHPIDTKAYSQSDWYAHVMATEWTAFSPQHSRPSGITLHNTAGPTLAEWSETDPMRLNRLHGLKSFYEAMGWHGGPHAFIGRTAINGFTPIQYWGVHCSCVNESHIGLEMVGDYAPGAENFGQGDGALVRNNAVFAVAALMLKLNLAPESDLMFHRECTNDHHACPGAQVDKIDIIARVRMKMNELKSGPPTPAPSPPAPQPVNATYTVLPGDTLYKIAREWLTTVDTLAQLNSLQPPYLITIGQILKLR